ncbi:MULTISPECIES: helix-turn-helix domain-containing protein [Chryseobacterium]|uniref:XRE family transcriptional regulator n=1 Tax=Chryseobacterium cucumeris TaxID=1813611 RepID=A0ABX9X3Q3_9FLAO|nr:MULTISPECIES: helix-turn-helix transcriptional regulator [Chryseobacterium]KYH03913.1 DNA-binding protein [Chryseobacterium cucumeris]MDH5031902.1 helix-turn-helix transcriptional regulator [Chryseobacterium cucumeris]MDH5036083.1 helix-turn-helix transcriptional regulator [Chryseobacterium cucumeris]ROH90183.1 XRE family transcriptional regulator [Chryseobacterium cucumeris]TXI94959.1 MAG: XRE family transcriptional regulator [Chryseobacterium cucumeris]
MNSESDFIKTVFGLKLKQQRQKKNWSLQDLAVKTGLSKSYLNEIENGKKYPKHDKIIQLSEALSCTFDDLVSTKLDKSLAPFNEILQSDFFKEVPLELFGINKNNLISIISDAPKKVTAFINALIEISQNYNLGKERFYFAVLRSFQELYDNYFPEIEEKVDLFTRENQLQPGKDLKSDILEAILAEKFSYTIQSEDFEKYGTLDNLRSLFIPEKKLLLLNQKLEKDQKTFILAKEIGFNVLELKNRPNTYSWLDFGSFEEILNNFYASYFAGALLISKEPVIEKTAEFFQQNTWEPKNFESLISSFTHSPETFYYRLTNILSAEMGIKDLFYLCLVKKKNSDKIQILKELHLNHQQAPHANAMNEHYCRRWIAVKNLGDLKENETLTDAQVSHYKDQGISYLVISTSQKNPFSDGSNRSYCLGILLNSQTIKKIGFIKSPSLKTINVGVTCESCSIADCEVRQAPPVRLEKEHFNMSMKSSVEKIRKRFEN